MKLPATGPSTDVVLGTLDTGAKVLVPISERARKLFAMWGMEEGVLGLVAPDDPMDFFSSSPTTWNMEAQALTTEEYEGEFFQEIPLPGEVLVVH